MSLLQNAIIITTVLPHHVYRPSGITMKFSPSPQ